MCRLDSWNLGFNFQMGQRFFSLSYLDLLWESPSSYTLWSLYLFPDINWPGVTLTIHLHHLPLVLKVNKRQSSIFTSTSRLITVLCHSVQDGLCEIKRYKILDDLTRKCQPHQNLHCVYLIPAISLHFFVVLLCHKHQTICFRSPYLFSYQICF